MKDKTIKIDLSKIANTALQEKVDKEGDMRTDTGELIENVEQQNTNIIDYNKKKAGN